MWLASGRSRVPAALWLLLLALREAAALDPVSVGLAIGVVSAFTGYLSYEDWFCRFAECCDAERPLNASGACGGWDSGGGAERGDPDGSTGSLLSGLGPKC